MACKVIKPNKAGNCSVQKFKVGKRVVYTTATFQELTLPELISELLNIMLGVDHEKAS